MKKKLRKFRRGKAEQFKAIAVSEQEKHRDAMAQKRSEHVHVQCI